MTEPKKTAPTSAIEPPPAGSPTEAPVAGSPVAGSPVAGSNASANLAAEGELDPETFGASQPCFGCSPSHPIGLKLRFERRGDEVITRWTPPEAYQGPPGILHGGLVTTVADEVAAWTVVALTGRFGFTASLEARLKNPIRIGRELVGVGRIIADGRRVVRVAVTLSQDDREAFAGMFKFALLNKKSAEQLLQQPLPPAWQRFCAPD